MSLPELRQDLKLYPGPAKSDGSPTWRIHDPVRNRFFEIGWVELELLNRWTPGITREALLEQVAEETSLEASPEELEALVTFVTTHELINPRADVDKQKLKSRWLATRGAWYTKVLHNYLFFRIPLFRPDGFLHRTLPYVRFMFTRGFAVFLAILALLDAHLVFENWGDISHTFAGFFDIQGAFYYALAATFAKVVHELGHAYAAKRFGVRVPTMGIAFLVMWPVLYTDTSESWKLREPKRRFMIAAAGMAAELFLALIATLTWSIVADGPLKTTCFLLASTTWVTTLAINLSPFMRFDGYYLLSDALNMPNLHQRSGALARQWMRRVFFSLYEEDPEPSLPPALKRKLVAFALITWVYRFVVFLAIAFAVYHFFLKVLGILLMAIEVVWFIARPIFQEIAYLWRTRSAVRPAADAFLALALIAVLLVWLFPVASQVEAPAIIRSAEEYAVYAPFTARLDAVLVKPGDSVPADALIARLESPDIRDRALRSSLQARAYAAELRRTAASTMQQERLLVLERQLNESISQYQAAVEDMRRLELRTPIGGIVRDLSSDMVAGRWLNTRTLILRVVEPHRNVVDAYIDESQLRAVQAGQSVRFYPDASNLPVVKGRIQYIDTAPIRTLPHPVLSGDNGGAIPATKNERGEFVAVHAMYRVRIAPDDDALSNSVVRGLVRIETDFFALAHNFVARTIALIIRESGF